MLVRLGEAVALRPSWSADPDDGMLGQVTAPAPAASMDPLAAGDAGLFGPGSVTWRIHGDPAMVFGGLRALLLQALHPLAMAGVDQHSNFAADPWGRLTRTAEYVGTVTYGTTDEARRAGRIVQAVHRRLGGVEPESGLAYRVADPHLVLWVHCAEVDSFLHAYRRCGGTLGAGEADAYLAEQVAAAELVGVAAADVPDSEAALRDYFAWIRPELRATAAAQEALRFVLTVPLPRPVTAAQPAWLWLAALAFRQLPRWARRLYGLPGLALSLPGSGVHAELAGRSLSTAVRMVPAGIRESPARRAADARIRGDGDGAVGAAGAGEGPR